MGQKRWNIGLHSSSTRVGGPLGRAEGVLEHLGVVERKDRRVETGESRSLLQKQAPTLF